MGDMHTLPQDVQEQLVIDLGDTDATQAFVRMAGHLLGEFNAPENAPQPKMKKRDATHKQIDALYSKAVALHKAIRATDGPAWERLATVSQEPVCSEVTRLIEAAGSALDQQVYELGHGQKATFSQADIERVKTIAVCFRKHFKYSVTAAEDTPFHDTVQTILGLDKSARALIKSALRI